MEGEVVASPQLLAVRELVLKRYGNGDICSYNGNFSPAATVSARPLAFADLVPPHFPPLSFLYMLPSPPLLNLMGSPLRQARWGHRGACASVSSVGAGLIAPHGGTACVASLAFSHVTLFLGSVLLLIQHRPPNNPSATGMTWAAGTGFAVDGHAVADPPLHAPHRHLEAARPAPRIRGNPTWSGLASRRITRIDAFMKTAFIHASSAVEGPEVVALVLITMPGPLFP